ncbi:hypothetical protein SSRV2_ORF13 [Saccharolobus shibatae rod virus 2]|nr:hypothetical protein SSRV2_ORF13 [Saccharolobus shibatae rod virus 2]
MRVVILYLSLFDFLEYSRFPFLSLYYFSLLLLLSFLLISLSHNCEYNRMKRKVIM